MTLKQSLIKYARTNWKDFIVKYIKYSAVGFIGFCISTMIFFLVAQSDYSFGWFFANICGGVFAFLCFHFKVKLYKNEGNTSECQELT